MTISVIVPAYNSAPFIAETLSSVTGQTQPPREIIVVDDGSTDDTAARVRDFGTAVKLLRMEQNAGVSKARNTGAAAACSHWLMFLDSDDLLVNTALEDLHSCVGKGNAGVVYGEVRQFGTAGITKTRGFNCAGAPPYPALKNFWRSAIPTPGAAIVDRHLHRQIGGFEKPWQPTEDRDYWMKCGVMAPFLNCGKVILHKRYRPDSSRSRSAIAVYWGMRVQLEFLEWCNSRDIDTAFLDTDTKTIVARAIKRTLQNGDRDTLKKIRTYVRGRGIPAPGRWYELYCRLARA